MHRLLYAEYLPWVIKRWEYVESPRGSKSYIWSYIGWPLNRGGCRDIPCNALFHHSVLGRMDLPPDLDPKNYRTKYYLPNNSWVQDRSEPRNLSELAKRSSPKNCDGESERQALLKKGEQDAKPATINFVLADDLTNTPVAIKGQSDAVEAKDWDSIYRVALKSH